MRNDLRDMKVHGIEIPFLRTKFQLLQLLLSFFSSSTFSFSKSLSKPTWFSNPGVKVNVFHRRMDCLDSGSFLDINLSDLQDCVDHFSSAICLHQ